MNSLNKFIETKKIKIEKRIKNLEFNYNKSSYILKELENKYLIQLFNFFQNFQRKKKIILVIHYLFQ